MKRLTPSVTADNPKALREKQKANTKGTENVLH